MVDDAESVVSDSSSRLLKSLLRANVLNDVTAALFLVSFSQLPAAKQNTEEGAAVTSIRLFLFCQSFRLNFLYA